MKTETIRSIIYATVYIRGNKHRIIKVIKRQLFAILNDSSNHTKHHLIGNLYSSVFHNWPIDIIQEKSICHIKPIILSKFTFRHEISKLSHKPSLFNHFNQIRDY